ncbi:MAG: alpha/beta hydrolase [Caulobacteraceae bacterium]
MPAFSDPPTLCLLPGLLCDATVWEAQRAAFADAMDVHVADLWGLDSFAGMARKVLDETAGPLAVAGHSMGARVALEMWRLAPGRVARLALLSTGFHGPRPEETAKRMGLVELGYREGMAAVAARWLPPMVHPDRIGDAALMGPLEAMVRRATPKIFEGQQRAGLQRPDASDYLPRIACPTLVLCGRQDGWSPVPQHEEMAGRIPVARLALVDACGHMATVERPDEVTLALSDWLTG